MENGGENCTEKSGLSGKGVGTPREQTAAKKVRDLGPEVASLTQGLVTQLKIRLDENEVIMRNLCTVKVRLGPQNQLTSNQRNVFKNCPP